MNASGVLGLLSLVQAKYEALEDYWGGRLPTPINEMSLLFRHATDLDNWTDAMEDGGLWFAESSEIQVCETEEEEFETEFQFSWPLLPGSTSLPPPYRIEAMTIHSGTAPLHKFAIGADDVCVIHASFALGTEQEYDHAREELLQDLGLKEFRAYRNGYGRFSYFMAPPLTRGVFLKPRVNLRDKEQA